MAIIGVSREGLGRLSPPDQEMPPPKNYFRLLE